MQFDQSDRRGIVLADPDNRNGIGGVDKQANIEAVGVKGPRRQKQVDAVDKLLLEVKTEVTVIKEQGETGSVRFKNGVYPSQLRSAANERVMSIDGSAK